MIAAARADLVTSETLFAPALSAWRSGDTGPNATAAGLLEAETIMLFRRWLRRELWGITEGG